MSRAFLSKAALLLALILLLAVPSMQAAEPRAGTSPVRDVPSRLAPWDVVTQVWDLLTRVWAGNGCRIDPSGRCVPYQSPSPAPDNGCGIDPNGGCVPYQSPSPEPDNGCLIDPDGRCGS